MNRVEDAADAVPDSGSRPQGHGSAVAADLMAGAAAALVLLVLFRRVWLGEVLFHLDLSLQFEPLRRLVADALRTGQLLWTPALSNGAPLLANPMAGIGYPPSLLFHLLARVVDPARALTWLALGHLVWGGVGAWLAARALGCRGPGRWTAAALVVLAGPTLSSTAFANLQWGLSWSPWLVLAGARLAGEVRFAPAVCSLAVVLALVSLTGDPVAVVAPAVGAAAFGLRSRRARRRFALRVVPAIALAALLAAPVLIPTLRLVAGSVRAAGFTADGVMLWSLHPLHSLELVLPGVFGDPSSGGWGAFWARALVSPRGHPLFLAMYLGLVPVVLACLGASRRGAARWPLVLWLALLFLLALGRFTPLGPLLAELPGGDALRFPVKWVAGAVLPLALLAGLGADAASTDPGMRRRLVVLTLVVLVLLGLGAAAVAAGLDGQLWSVAVESSLQPGSIPPLAPTVADVRAAVLHSAARAALPMLGLLAVLAASAWWVGRAGAAGGSRGGPGCEPPPPVRQGVGWAAAALVAVDLLAANAALVPTLPIRELVTPPPLVGEAVVAAGEGRVWIDPRRLALPAAEPSSPQQAMLTERRALRGYTAAGFGARLAYNVDIEALTSHGYTLARSLAESAPPRERMVLLAAAGVSALVSGEPTGLPLEGRAEAAGGGRPPLAVVELGGALPRARMVQRLSAFEGVQGFISAVSQGGDDLFRHTALVSASDLRRWSSTVVDRSMPSTCRLVEDRGSRLEVETSGGGGFLIVTDNLVTGWSAAVDGRRQPMFRADLGFRGLAVPPGEHRVTMRYDPWWGPTAPGSP